MNLGSTESEIWHGDASASSISVVLTSWDSQWVNVLTFAPRFGAKSNLTTLNRFSCEKCCR